MNKVQKLISVFISAALIVSAIPLTGFVGLELPEFDFILSAQATASGQPSGNELTWTYDDDTGLLTVSGTGAMDDYSWNTMPWGEKNQFAETAVIGEGVTRIGNYAFAGCGRLASVVIPASVTDIGSSVFEGCSRLSSISVADGNTAYCAVDGVLFSADMTTLICYPPSKAGSSYIIPESVTRIAEFAFEGACGLVSLTLGSGVTDIENCAFGGCVTLLEVHNLSALEIELGSYGFGEITSYAVNIRPAESTSSMLRYVGDFIFLRWGNLLYLVKYTGTSSTVTLPGEVTCDGGTYYSYNIYRNAFYGNEIIKDIIIPDSVTSIGDYAFSDCYALETVEMTNSITSMGDAVFNRCEALKSINISDNVTSLGNFIFGGCCSLSEVNIPDGVTSIGCQAFYMCTCLTEIEIPAGITEIGEAAFYNCVSLKDIRINTITADLTDSYLGFCDMAFTEGFTAEMFAEIMVLEFAHVSESELVARANTIFGTEYANLDELGAYLDEILITYNEPTVADSVVLYGYAGSKVNFYAAENGIRFVSLGGECVHSQTKTVNAVAATCMQKGYSGDTVCMSCGTVIAYGQSIPALGHPDTVTVNKNPATCTQEGYSGDIYCNTCHTYISYGVPVAALGHTPVKLAGHAPTATQTGLTDGVICSVCGTVLTPQMVIPASGYSRRCGDNVTWWLDPETGVLYILGTGKMWDYDSRSPWYNNSTITSVIISDGVTSIGDNAFWYCKELTSVDMPDGLTRIGCGAFSSCYKLASIDIPESVTSIDSSAFVFCSGLNSVHIPAGVTEIADNPFRGCSSLTGVNVDGDNRSYCSADGILFTKDFSTLICYPACKTAAAYTVPDGVTAIGEYAYYNCDNITHITISDSVTDICDGAFDGCRKLTDISFGSAVESIGNYSFGFCDSLTSVSLPDSLTYIDYYAFSYCTGLTSVSLGSGVAEIESEVFGNCSSLISINVDENNRSFCSVDGVLFDKNKETLLQYPIGRSAKTYIFPATVRVIGSNSFSGCENLISLTVPDSVKVIEYGAFSECTSLGVVDLGNGVEEIYGGTFNFCYMLTSVIVGENVKHVMSDAFDYCPLLSDVYIRSRDIELERSGIGRTDFEFRDIGAAMKYVDIIRLYAAGMPEAEVLAYAGEVLDWEFDDWDDFTDYFYVLTDSFISDTVNELTVVHGYVGSTAHAYCEATGITFASIDGEKFVTLNGADKTADGTVGLCGRTLAGTAVSILVDGVAVGSARSNAAGVWEYTLALDNPSGEHVYAVSAAVFPGTADEAVSNTISLFYSPHAIVFENFTMHYRGRTVTVTNDKLINPTRFLTYTGAAPFSFSINYENADKIATMRIVSTKNGEKKYLPAAYDSASGVWIAGGYFDGDISYIPGNLTLEINGTEQPYPEMKIVFVIDPSGYVYEAVASNRLENVTATVYFMNSLGETVKWNAQEADQLNPLLTDVNGDYAWNVPEGKWKVVFTKDGYETAESEWLPVPPIQTDINIGLVSTELPCVSSAAAYPGGIDLTFSQYMNVGTINSQNITVSLGGEVVSGTWTAVNAEHSPVDSEIVYATQFTFTSDALSAGTALLTLAGVANYAGISDIRDNTLYLDIGAKVDTLDVQPTLALSYNANGQIIVSAEPGAAVQGMTVCAVCDNDYTIRLSSDSAVFDAQGKAVFTVYALTAGEVNITFIPDDSLLSAKTAVTVEAPVQACNHQPEADAAVAATCTHTGLTEGWHCSFCGEVLAAQQTVAKLAHTVVTVPGRAATCTETGLSDGSRCAVCGEVLSVQTVIPAIGHVDVNGDGLCDLCQADMGIEKPAEPGFFSGILAFFRRIIEWFKGLFGKNVL